MTRAGLAIAIGTALAVAGCGGEQGKLVDDRQARVRNAPPSYCTDAQFGACEPMAQEDCADGMEPVIDYDSQCCPHFSCQPACPPGAVAVGCDGWPAPTCPPGTDLVIGSDEQCCAVYRCRPRSRDSMDCDNPMATIACPAAYPYCGDGQMPVEVGLDANCCPIYQCPCGGFVGPIPVPPGGEDSPDMTPPSGGTSTDPSGMSGSGPPPDPSLPPEPDKCGCTYPTCAFGETLVCRGENICGYPCECVGYGPPPVGDCTSDQDCMEGSYCNSSQCLPPPGCDCPPGTPMDQCPACPAVCYGKCEIRGGVINGCGGDADCGPGYACQIVCEEFMAPPGTTCPDGTVLGPNDYLCKVCNGSCIAGGTCGRTPTSGGTGGTSSGGSGVACPSPGVCPDGSMPFPAGTDPMTCCPIWQCASNCTPTMFECPVPQCDNPTITGIDGSCCPIACCPNADGTCSSTGSSPCRADSDCRMGQRCVVPEGCLGGPVGCTGQCR